jgi:hypothetical protein
MSTLEHKMKSEVSGVMFADRLRFFVQRYAPREPQEMYEFQMAMTRLMVDAMRHQQVEFSLGVEGYASQLLADRSMRPLAVIMEKAK